MVKVLFVCLGNICRSPMAEAVFKDLVAKENLSDKIFVDSAATSSYEIGNEVHFGTKKILDKIGISTKGMIARRIKDSDLDFDYIIGMDENNIKDINTFINHRKSGKVKLLLEFAKENRSIKDPYYTGDFEKTYEDVLKGCKALLEHIKKGGDIFEK